MQLKHYVWAFDVNVNGLFVTKSGDRMDQVGPDEYVYRHPSAGDISLTFSDLAIADFLRRNYITLDHTSGEPVKDEFKPIIRNEAGVEKVLNLEARIVEDTPTNEVSPGVASTIEIEPAKAEESNPLAEALLSDPSMAEEDAEEAVIGQTVKTVKRGRPAKKGK